MNSVPENLGTLQSVALRTIWSDEAQNFTPWLARAENLRRLGDVLGLDLTTEEEEVAVGPFSADILCKDMTDGSWVVIENQIEKTDHRHLGQVLTYAAGLGAKTMIWVAAKFTDEHRAALDWLNDNTGQDISFFGLEIELWRIGDSIPAPKFNVVSKPNDWSKAVRTQAAATTESAITPHKQLQFEFWTAFKEYVEKNSSLRTQKPAHQHWLNLSIGRAGFHLAAITSAWNTVTNSYGVPELRVELNLTGSIANQAFAALESHKEEVEAKCDLPITWHNPTESKSCKLYVRRDGDFANRGAWPELFGWLLRYMELFRAVFGPLIHEL
jgi:hypothetical protein